MAITVGDIQFETYDPGLQIALAQAYTNHVRPLCMCVGHGIEMYIARVGEKYIIKRMPSTGIKHSMHCESYEPPAELSGSGQLLGSAIKDDIETGVTDLRFDFSLSKSPGRAKAAGNVDPKKTAKSEGTKLTLRGLLHYLWEEAGFNRFTPAMKNKRNWNVIRKYLMEALSNKQAKNDPLSSYIFVPEPFVLDRKAEIDARRLHWFTQKHTSVQSDTKSTHLNIVIAPYKLFEQTRFGHRLTLKHLPDMPFVVNDELYRRFYKRFATERMLVETYENLQGIVIATFVHSTMKPCVVEEMAMIVVDSHFVPLENKLEAELLERAIKEERRILKPLRYNLSELKPMPALILSDTEDSPTAIYIISPEFPPEYLRELDKLLEESTLKSIVWDISSGVPLTFPPNNYSESQSNTNELQFVN